MSSALRRRRMARNHRRLGQNPRLNLVALMDIFTILVLFLIVNNGDVEVLQPERGITLPESVSEQRPEPALTIRISATGIAIDGRDIADVETVLAEPGDTIAVLAQALQGASEPGAQRSAPERDSGRPVVIMADREIPYQLLKRVMTTCGQSDYRNISLAVNAAPPAPPTEPPPTEPLLAATGVSEGRVNR